MFEITSDLSTEGILYVLMIDLEDKTLVKIGVTTRPTVEHRVCEILTSIWKRYRVFPQTYVKRFRKVNDVFSKEALLHEKFQYSRYELKHKVSGGTEFFDVEIDKVIEAYEELCG